MKPLLAVLRVTEAFGSVWSELGTSARVEVCVREAGAHALPAEEARCGILVAAGGEERAAAAVLGELRGLGVPVAVVGAETDYRLATALMRGGASDYFALPGDLGRLRSWVMERAELWTAAQRAGSITEGHREAYNFSRILGRSPGVLEALERASRVIPRHTTTVLLLGETGTGKELFAQAIHYNGPRAAEPFVGLNCAALPASMLEAELFGYERGAFTDARAAKPGLFELADRGTLFLDEVGDLTPELQAKLLKVLEDRRLRRLGSVRERELDVRVIAATHLDLEAAVRQGRFRADLYYRLGVVPIRLPPLRARGDDVLLLAEHFLDRFSRELNTPRPPLTPAMRREMLAHPWKGNVRELRNAMERAVVLGGGVLRPGDVFLSTESPLQWGAGVLPFPASLEEISRAAARAAVAGHGGNKSAAAEALGISRKYLYALLQGGSARE